MVLIPDQTPVYEHRIDFARDVSECQQGRDAVRRDGLLLQSFSMNSGGFRYVDFKRQRSELATVSIQNNVQSYCAERAISVESDSLWHSLCRTRRVS